MRSRTPARPGAGHRQAATATQGPPVAVRAAAPWPACADDRDAAVPVVRETSLLRGRPMSACDGLERGCYALRYDSGGMIPSRGRGATCIACHQSNRSGPTATTPTLFTMPGGSYSRAPRRCAMFVSGNVTVYVSNMDAAVHFYSDILGLRLANRHRADWAPVGNGTGLDIR